MLWKVLLGTASAVAMMGVSTTAYAGNSQALLKRLHDKGILSDAEYAELMKDEAEAPAPVAAPVVAGDTTKFVRATDSGIGLQVGPATIKFSGSINGFYVYDNAAKPGANTAVTGGIASVGGTPARCATACFPAS